MLKMPSLGHCLQRDIPILRQSVKAGNTVVIPNRTLTRLRKKCFGIIGVKDSQLFLDLVNGKQRNFSNQILHSIGMHRHKKFWSEKPLTIIVEGVVSML
jgi:hypothetical protein